MRYEAHIIKFLSKNRLMSLATSLRNKTWAATVFFAYDANCNLFFFSNPRTKHCKDIARNPHVAVTFNQYTGKPNSIKGLQIIGRASKVPRKNLAGAYARYRARYRWADKFASDHALYVIRPAKIHYIDQKLFGHFFRVRVK
ncbi:MAG: pyridoxamine 5'-phosphate oxidase family protein [Candidatus Liptonbacteria bacterium]|nr:pyridoxamine 5'-phosphate oxidase family protein [Candidatus Liptonbacteria bacterium]